MNFLDIREVRRDMLVALPSID
ncbi:hypothetical protein EMIT0194P_20292 [Pseudomonas serbica]